MAKDDVNLVYWAAGDKDDQQLVPVDSGVPNIICVLGLGGMTLPGGDDGVIGTDIHTGADGICQTIAIPPDIQLIDFDCGWADQPCVGPGTNGVLETDPAGDDTYADDFTSILTGPDGICNTTAFTGPEGHYALTAVYHDTSTGIAFEADIHMNDDIEWNVGEENDPKLDIQNTLTHEIGHFLGLHHSEIAAATMSNTWPADTTKRSLEVDDRRGCNFLYTPDMGDAPDIPYPSEVHRAGGRTLNGVTLDSPDSGAEHIFGTKGHGDPDNSYLYEWLGADVGPECESYEPADDPRDDGVKLSIVGDSLQIDVVVKTGKDAANQKHDYSAHHLYLNIWVDWNNNGRWRDDGDHVVGPDEIVDPPGGTSPSAQLKSYRFAIRDSAWIWWVRTRLDWGEDCGLVANINGDLDQETYGAQFGEVEDRAIRPTAIELASFSAVDCKDHIRVTWSTAHELDNAGFRLHRSLSRNDQFVQINDGLIAAKGDAVLGATYAFADYHVKQGVTYYYWLEDVDRQSYRRIHGPTTATLGSGVVKDKIPAAVSLAQNYPNPFRATTEIIYGLPVDSAVNLTIYNLLGQTVRTLVDEHQPAGFRVAGWDGRNDVGAEVSGGIYFYVLRAGDHMEVKKMTFLR
jgi:hypothetical protein